MNSNEKKFSKISFNGINKRILLFFFFIFKKNQKKNEIGKQKRNYLEIGKKRGMTKYQPKNSPNNKALKEINTNTKDPLMVLPSFDVDVDDVDPE